MLFFRNMTSPPETHSTFTIHYSQFKSWCYVEDLLALFHSRNHENHESIAFFYVSVGGMGCLLRLVDSGYGGQTQHYLHHDR